jgi:hypothetical protein
MDPAKFARQFARIRERDTERASRARIAPVSAETEAARAPMSCSEFYERVTGRKLSDAAKAVLDAPKPELNPVKAGAPMLRGTTLDFVIVDDVVTP